MESPQTDECNDDGEGPDGDERVGSERSATCVASEVRLRIGWLIACERLTAVNGPNGAGVTRTSLDSEVAWRKQATFSRRLGRCIQNIVRWF
jgi:hypothetical protein